MSKNSLVTTLNIKHNEIINEMQLEEAKIPILEAEKTRLQDENNELIINDSYIYNKKYIANIEEINIIEKTLAQIKKMRLDYYIKNAGIIFEYNETDKAISFTKNTPINNCFKNKNSEINGNTQIVIPQLPQPIGMASVPVISMPSKSKAELLKIYLANNDPDYVIPSGINTNPNIFCNICNINRELNEHEAKLICRNCGESIQIILESDKPISKDYPTETRHYEYKKFNHFCYWLAKIQGKESCDIPEEVIETIRKAIKKDKIGISGIDDSIIKDYLKRYKNIGYDKYYNHTIYILMKITGIPPITLTLEQEKEYKMMFIIIQELWLLYKPDDRSNFGSYSYIIYKFAQLRGDKYIMRKMKLLKCKEKLHELDIIWKSICKHLGGEEKGWKFMHTY